MTTLTRTVVTAAVLLLVTSPLYAQPKPGYAPSSTHIFPAGGQRGTTVSVRVGTECAPPGCDFLLRGEGVSTPKRLGQPVLDDGEPSPRRAPTEIPLSYPRQWESEIKIEASAPTGTIHWRISSAQGGTASRPFVIGELPEWIEQESNSTPARAEAIQLPITVNGQVHGERDADYFRFHASRGQLVVCEVVARRIGSPLDPLVEIQDRQGRPLRSHEGYLGEDPVLAFRAPQEGHYLLRICNISPHGSPAYVYRLNLTSKPFACFCFPTGGTAGSKQDFTLYALDGTASLMPLRRTIQLPAEETTNEEQQFAIRDPELSGMLQVSLDDEPHRVEVEPNNLRGKATELAVPTILSGRFQAKADEDWFSFTAQADAHYELTCRAFPTALACFPTISLIDHHGKEIASSRSVEAADGRCRLEWTAAKPGTCYVRARELRGASQGGDQLIYQLAIRQANPDFQLRLASDSLNIVQGGEASLDVELIRHGGFQGEVTLEVADLPEGLTLNKSKIAAGQTSGKLQLAADEDARSQPHVLQLTGVAEIEGQQLRRAAQARHLGADSEGRSIGPATLDKLHLTVRHKPVFRLYCAEAYQYAHRGTVYPYLMEIERLDGFQGEIVVQNGDRQNRDMDGIQMLDTRVTPGQSTFELPIHLPETMHINIQSQSQLYAQAYAQFVDKHGLEQSVLVLSEKRNMLRTLPPVVKLVAADKQLAAEPGETMTVGLQLERTSNFPGGMKLEITGPAASLVRSLSGAEIAAGATDGKLRVQLHSKSKPGNYNLRVRATGNLPNGDTAITEATVPLVVR